MSVPIGRPTLLVPPTSGRKRFMWRSSATVLCSSSPRSAPLPELTPQPAGKPPLTYPREPCVFVHGDARRALAIDMLVVIAALATLAYLRRRSHRARVTPTGVLEPEPA